MLKPPSLVKTVPRWTHFLYFHFIHFLTLCSTMIVEKAMKVNGWEYHSEPNGYVTSRTCPTPSESNVNQSLWWNNIECARDANFITFLFFPFRYNWHIKTTYQYHGEPAQTLRAGIHQKGDNRLENVEKSPPNQAKPHPTKRRRAPAAFAPPTESDLQTKKMPRPHT